MRILLITDEEWNDYVYGNNILTNWFAGFDAEFAQIYCSPGLPNNSVCDRYFRITDGEMVHSLMLGPRAGHVISLSRDVVQQQASKENAQRKGIYKVMKKVSLKMHTPVMLIRDLIWCCGRYDKKSLRKFVKDFEPDIVFCPRLITPKLMRLEKMVFQYTKAPFVAFTADDEASLQQVSYSPLFWARRLWIRRKLKSHVKIYKQYLTFSKDQAEEYQKKYNIPTSTLFKCGDFKDEYVEKPVGHPIQMVYAGRLYCHRWFTLGKIGQALREINKDDIKIVLNVYSQGTLSKKQREVLSPENFIFFKGAISPAELKEVYSNADIALHVESFEKKYMYATRVSFSTKIIDLMASTCAIMAICWSRHAGYQYLKENDAAFCIDNEYDILPMIRLIVGHPELITKMQRRAWECGRMNHEKEFIQSQIKELFKNIMCFGYDGYHCKSDER